MFSERKHYWLLLFYSVILDDKWAVCPIQENYSIISIWKHAFHSLRVVPRMSFMSSLWDKLVDGFARGFLYLFFLSLLSFTIDQLWFITYKYVYTNSFGDNSIVLNRLQTEYCFRIVQIYNRLLANQIKIA